MKHITHTVCSSLCAFVFFGGGCEAPEESLSADGAFIDTDALDTDPLESFETDAPVLDSAVAGSESPVDPETESSRGDDEEFRSTPSVYISNHHRHFAGNIVPETHIYTVGGACSANHIRSSFSATYNAFGNCSAVWASSNPTDCQVVVTANTMAFWGAVNCYVSIWQERAGGTCGRTGQFCGGAGSDGSCYCDIHCSSYGDCCFDYDTQC